MVGGWSNVGQTVADDVCDAIGRSTDVAGASIHELVS